MPDTPHLTVAGVLFGCLVVWWILANAIARTFDVIRTVRSFIQGE